MCGCCLIIGKMSFHITCSNFGIFENCLTVASKFWFPSSNVACLPQRMSLLILQIVDVLIQKKKTLCSFANTLSPTIPCNKFNSLSQVEYTDRVLVQRFKFSDYLTLLLHLIIDAMWHWLTSLSTAFYRQYYRLFMLTCLLTVFNLVQCILYLVNLSTHSLLSSVLPIIFGTDVPPCHDIKSYLA